MSIKGSLRNDKKCSRKTNNLFHGFVFICAFIYDVLILTEGDWTDHIQNLELTLNKLKEKRPKCNIEIYLFEKTKMEFVSF